MRKFFQSVAYAFSGIRTAFKSERNFRIHICIAAVVIIVGLFIQLSIQAWGFVIISIGFVFAAELVNTAVERLGDETANGKLRQRVKNAKDISAGAVLIAALTAAVIGIIFLLIPLIQKLLGMFS
jgi:diacylglycerol kinase